MLVSLAAQRAVFDPKGASASPPLVCVAAFYPLTTRWSMGANLVRPVEWAPGASCSALWYAASSVSATSCSTTSGSVERCQLLHTVPRVGHHRDVDRAENDPALDLGRLRLDR